MLNKAQLYLLDRKLKEADPLLGIVLQADPRNAAALIGPTLASTVQPPVSRRHLLSFLSSFVIYLGKAQLDYQRGHYEAALSALRSVLQNQPNCPASVRVGLGMCFAKLKQLDKVCATSARLLPQTESSLKPAPQTMLPPCSRCKLARRPRMLLREPCRWIRTTCQPWSAWLCLTLTKLM